MISPRLRLTLGNIAGLLVAGVGIVVDNAAAVRALSPVHGDKIVAFGLLIGACAKGLFSFNHAQIPTGKKVELAPGVLFEKTGLLKPPT